MRKQCQMRKELSHKTAELLSIKTIIRTMHYFTFFLLCLPTLIWAQVDLSTIANNEFKKIDANKDENLDKNEIKQFFEAYDTNHDNRVTRHEYDSAVDRAHAHDAVTSHVLTALFDDLDSNTDNHLDDADYDKLISAADANKNNLVSLQEFLSLGYLYGSLSYLYGSLSYLYGSHGYLYGSLSYLYGSNSHLYLVPRLCWPSHRRINHEKTSNIGNRRLENSRYRYSRPRYLNKKIHQQCNFMKVNDTCAYFYFFLKFFNIKCIN
ncbi:hypothetical protein Btru_070221 [Bulinus truncatus]|nr:hypothetical protein Btru_070221 [Bulinus truncatus]